jgi:hypothetical protein
LTRFGSQGGHDHASESIANCAAPLVRCCRSPRVLNEKIAMRLDTPPVQRYRENGSIGRRRTVPRGMVMTTTIRVRLALALLCTCVLVRTSWAQHGAGGHAGGGGGVHAGGGASFGGHAAFHPSAPSPAPRPFYGSFSSYRGSPPPFAFRGPGHFVRPGAGFQQFRGSSGAAPRSAFAGGRFPRSAYLAGRSARYWSQRNSQVPSGTSPTGSRGTHLTASNRPPVTSFHSHPVQPYTGSWNPFFGNVFLRNRPFFFWPFYYPTFTWWWYPPLTFSDNYAPQGCPYDDYYYQQQQQPYYQPEEQGGEAEQPAESAEEAANVPPAQPQPEAQTAPFAYEKPLPDVIEWGTASEAAPQTQPATAGKGPLVVNLPHHTLTILLNEPSSLSVPAP